MSKPAPKGQCADADFHPPHRWGWPIRQCDGKGTDIVVTEADLTYARIEKMAQVQHDNLRDHLIRTQGATYYPTWNDLSPTARKARMNAMQAVARYLKESL